MSDSTLVDARIRSRETGDAGALVALIPYAGFLGVQMRRDDQQWLSHLPFRAGLIGNPALQALHGGVTAAFMENAAMLHLLVQLDEDRIPKNIDFSIDYLLPGRARDLYAACTVSRAGLRVAQVQIRCWQDTPEQAIAMARAHFLLGKPE
jgi:uncharacterized protein (TIGR00369 family)